MKKKALDLKEFAKTAKPEHVQEFVDAICGGYRPQLYQLTGGHRRLGPEKAKQAAKLLSGLGYNVPLHKLRPDIWDKGSAA